MKKHNILFLCIGLFAICILSCKKYLDKAPASTFTPDEVFENYANFKLYFDGIFKGTPGPSGTTLNYMNTQNIFCTFNLYFNGIPRKFSLEQLTDLCDGGWIRENQPIKGGNMGSNISLFYDNNQQRPLILTYFSLIRKCNVALQNIPGIKDAPTPEDIYDLYAQAYFARAFSHFALFRFWGSLPYITKVIGTDDQWDMFRLSKYETCKRMADDLDTAYTYFVKAGRVRRDDPSVSGVGHLNSPDQFRPNGVTSKALKGRILLYAASPLNNAHGVTDWQDAAIANWDAIQIAEQNNYFMLLAADYKLNYIGANYTNEELWAWAAGSVNYSNYILNFLINGVFQLSGNTSSDCPTQNCVDMFETKWGDPLNTQADRDAATALGHYNEQDPYANREPRFYIDIIYNQAPIPGYTTAQIYTQTVGGVTTYSELLNQLYPGITFTGYYERKLWGGQSVKNNISPLHSDPFIRLKELYLNYAEAANEAYGPNTPAPGATLTAVQAINKVRERIGQVDVQPQFTTSTDVFRPRIKNERTVELCFEGHYYFDERRWMDAPVSMGGPMMGMSVEKVAVSPTYPIGFKHTRMAIPANRQSAWKDAMYYFPFKDADYFKMKNFDMSLNPRW